MNPQIILNAPPKSNHYNDNGTVTTQAPLFEKKNDEKEKDEDQESGQKPPSAVLTEDDTNKEAPSSLTGSSTNKMEMANQFLEALKGDNDLKAMLKLVMGSTNPATGSGANG
jgi:hypothetical protein